MQRRGRGRPLGRRQLKPDDEGFIPWGLIERFHDPRATPDLPLGAIAAECPICHALFWKYELVPASNPKGECNFNLCCKKGDISLPAFRDPPDLLRRLFTYQHPQSRHFLNNIRRFNSALAFTSVKFEADKRLGEHARNVPFQIRGEFFHLQGPLIPRRGESAMYAQTFIIDTAEATDIRHARNPNLLPSLLRSLDETIRQYNPWFGVYNSAREHLEQASHSQETRIVITPQLKLVMEKGADSRRENLPTAHEIALLLPGEEGSPCRRDLILSKRPARQTVDEGSHLQTISYNHALYMPLHYVLFYLYGEPGRNLSGRLNNIGENRIRVNLSAQMYYRYYLFTRPDEVDFNLKHRGCGLWQQILVDMYHAIEQERLDHLRAEQGKLRVERYVGLQDQLLRDDVTGATVGQAVVLPSSFTGGDRAMQQLFQDSMALVTHYGSPSLFITFTANPHWDEIKNELFEHQDPTNRPDIVARVFRMKLKYLYHLLREGYAFGPCLALIYTIEYQKRGLPHAHILFWGRQGYAFREPDEVDKIIRAELPDRELDPDGSLTAIIKSNLTHRLCGPLNPGAVCMKKKHNSEPASCSKQFPKSFCNETRMSEDGYPEYRRRAQVDRHVITWGEGAHKDLYDNRWVVPYNPYLTRLLKAHINVEICSTVRAIKYIHKYIYKGRDKVTLEVTEMDEIKRYLTCRYIGPSQAVWNILEFPTHEEYPSIMRLALHLPHEQSVTFPRDAGAPELQQQMDESRSNLMAYFEYNRDHPDGRYLKYHEFPEHYTYQGKAWRRRKGNTKAVGRVYHCNPTVGERYYLRLLLITLPGPTSFENLRTVDGTTYDTFQAACLARGLIDNDNHWIECFNEARLIKKGHGFRSLFIIALTHGSVVDPKGLWEKFARDLADDVRRGLQELPGVPECADQQTRDLQDQDYALHLIEQSLIENQETLAKYHLPQPVFDWGRIRRNPLISHELNYDVTAEQRLRDSVYGDLNVGQKVAFDVIVRAVEKNPLSAHFFLQGYAGTGKTFLYTLLCHHFRAQGKIVLCVASSGIAALLLPGGQTSHSRFKIPLNAVSGTRCTVSKGTQLAGLLEQTALVIWDEVPMQNKYDFEAVDAFLKDIRDCDQPFGGVPMVLGGDFAQILPVVKRSNRARTVAATLQQSPLWNHFTILRLTQNMRVQAGGDNQLFTEWIRRMSYEDGMYGRLPLPPYIRTTSRIADLYDRLYPVSEMRDAAEDIDFFRNRAILTTRNNTVASINEDVLRRLLGVEKPYDAVDKVTFDEIAQGSDPPNITQEFLRSQNPSGLPPSRLLLKVGAPIICLRNLFPREGLCNGTRLIITQMRVHNLEARILGGQFHGQTRIIPKIGLTADLGEGAWKHHRKQFPVRLCFAMTINKAQGQSVKRVGVDLRRPVFTHGQLYVALSRVTDVSNLDILLPERGGRTVENIVYPEVLLR